MSAVVDLGHRAAHGVRGQSGTRHWRRLLAVLAALALLLLTAGYVGASAFVYNSMSAVPATCDGAAKGNVPTSFSVENALTKQPVDVRPYLLPEPQEVRFASRGAPEIQIAGWWIPAAAVDGGATAPAIVLVHGQFSCRHEAEILLAAGMLHRHGYSTLLIDLRDHGDSVDEDGRYSGGAEEFADVLGAWDWLRASGLPASRIGLLGISMGAAAALIATGEEPQVAAVWDDSSYADISAMLRDELERNGFPSFLEPGAVVVGRVVAGDDITARSPLTAVAKLDGRPIFITHGLADGHIRPAYSQQLADVVNADGGHVTPWFVANADHSRAITIATAEYEQRLVAFFDQALAS
jgi:dipeptidyl aminopeptidase/acylaminoacyl peptidase